MGIRKTKDVLNTSGIPDDAKREIKHRKISVKIDRQTSKGAEKYSKRQFLNVYEFYDAFENFMFVRRYIQKRYDIGLPELEMLLYLMPKQYFTVKDYSNMPKRINYFRIQNFVETGLISQVTVGWKIQYTDMYTVSKLGKSIAKEFYQCLSGEKKVPQIKSLNPLAGVNGVSPYDKRYFRMLTQLNSMDVPESRKALYDKKPEDK